MQRVPIHNPPFHLTLYRDLRDAEATWRLMETSAPAYVFQTYDWLSTWYKTIGLALRVEPFIVVASDGDDRLAALLPLAIRRRFGCRILEFLGAIATDYNAPLCEPEDALLHYCSIDELLSRIVALAKPDLVRFEQMPEHLADNRPNPMVRQRHARHVANAYTASLPSTFAEFTRGRNSKYFSETRRKRRNLARQGAVRFAMFDDPDEIAQTVNVLLRQKQQKYGSRYVDRRAMPAFEEFYRRMAAAPLHAGRSLTACLRVDNVIVATAFGVLYDRRFYGLMSGHEGGMWARMSPGRLLLYELVQWCIDANVATFDLTVGDEDYKPYWSDHRMKVYESCYAVTALGEAFLAAKRLSARWRE